MKLPFQYKAVIVFILLMNVSFFFTGYTAKTLMETALLQRKENHLFGFTRILDATLGPDGFAGILRAHGAENFSRDEKIKILNEALFARSENVGVASEGLGVGYYSRELDAIVTYSPAAQFGTTVGSAIAATHPGRVVMKTNRPAVRTGTMVRGDIMNAMLPIARDGDVIGYIWANELMEDVHLQFSTLSRGLFLILLLCFVLTVTILMLFARRAVGDMDRIIRGVCAMRTDLSHRIPPMSGDIGEVARNINAMAADVSRANEETSRAVTVLRSVMNNVDAAVYVCDPQTMKLVYTNGYLQELLGRKDLVGKLCYEVLHNTSQPCSFCPQPQLFDNDNLPIMTPVMWEMHNDMLNRDFLVTDRLVTWHDGKLVHMEVSTDITERKALAVVEAASVAQRDFLARMSHEIRTPMNGVLGMTRLALQASPPPVQLEYLKKIDSSASLLLGILNDILDFSRIEAGKLTIEKQVFDLLEMLETIQELILPHIQEKKLAFDVILDETVPRYVVGDKLRLSQVLLNLLGNAAKFTLRGRVTLSMEAQRPEPDVLCLHCSVRDTGIGMSAEQQEVLFKPFSQADSSTSRRFGGTGLGLSICKALVELLGGEISLHSVEGEGSTFSFFVFLGVGEELQCEESREEESWQTVNCTGQRFLLVEDNAINQEIAQAFLEDMGATVDVADNGEEAVKAFHSDVHYDIIFMDMRMPILDGIEATMQIRASEKADAKTVPIIAMTANVMMEDREASKNAGMDDHLAKPIDVDTLKKILHKYKTSSQA